MAKGKITVDQWRAELERLRPNDPGQTVTEIADENDLPRGTVQGMIRKGAKEGRYLKGWACRKDSTGRQQKIAVYRLKEGEI